MLLQEISNNILKIRHSIKPLYFDHYEDYAGHELKASSVYGKLGFFNSGLTDQSIVGDFVQYSIKVLEIPSF